MKVVQDLSGKMRPDLDEVPMDSKPISKAKQLKQEEEKKAVERICFFTYSKEEKNVLHQQHGVDIVAVSGNPRKFVLDITIDKAKELLGKKDTNKEALNG